MDCLFIAAILYGVNWRRHEGRKGLLLQLEQAFYHDSAVLFGF